MKHLASLLILLFLMATLSACLVRTGPRHSHRGSHAKSCPPSYHWSGGACVHNSNRGKGHHKKHRR